MERILVVDDDAVIRDLIAAILEDEAHYEVVQAVNGREALKRLRESVIDAIICDVNMPVMSGIELIQAVRADSRLRRTPVVVVSAVATPATLDPSLDADVLIEKPFDITTLTACLDFALNEQHSHGRQIWVTRGRAIDGCEPPGRAKRHHA